MGGIHWDYEGYALADGTIQPINLTYTGTIQEVRRGDRLIIAWDKTGYDGDESRILIWVGSNPDQIIYEKDLIGASGVTELVVNNPTSAAVTVLLSRSWTNRQGPRFMGKYIKVRLVKA